jgi:hypothetical protein
MSNNGNQYFETINRMQGELTEEALIARMGECNAILGELANSKAWQVLLKDARQLIKTLDDNWQHIIPTSDKFEEARVMKMSCKHIADFPAKYLKELHDIELELKKIQNPEELIKDSDPN